MIYSFIVTLLSLALIIFNRVRVDSLALLLAIYCIFIFFTLAFNAQNQDYLNYVDFFNSPSERIEIGYKYLVEILKYVGFVSHFGVLLALSTLITLTLVNLYRYSPHLPFFLIFYLMFLFPVDVVQIRNSFSVFIILNAILFLYKKKYILFILLSFIAATFHSMAILYATLTLTSLLLRGKSAYLLILLFLTTFTVFIELFLSNTLLYDVPPALANYVTDGKVSSVLVWGFSIVSFVFLANCFIFKNLIKLSNINPRLDFAYFIYAIILASLIFLPGLYFLFEFNRLYRFIFILILIFMGAISFHLPVKNKLYMYIYLVCLFGFFGFYYSSGINFDWILFGF
jgi:hypothetical protein